MNPKTILRESILARGYLRRKRIQAWIKAGYPLPLPAELKQEAVFYHAINRHLAVLVETGTFLGDMVFAQAPYFRKIYSIELSQELFDRARKRFMSFPNTHLLQGDSSVKLREVVEQLDSAALFWLDGHYSGGNTARGELSCPIYAELQHVFASPFEHTVLIDDARLFNGTDDYPTLDELQRFVAENSEYDMRTENDMFVLSRPSSKLINR
jgi:hypothetical protein